MSWVGWGGQGGQGIMNYKEFSVNSESNSTISEKQGNIQFFNAIL